MHQFSRLKISPQVFQFLIHFAIAFAAGSLWFFILYHRYPLYTSHVNWIYNAGGDLLQHQLGWEFFRQEPWRFPLGTIQSYGYPVGTSVTFMDSIPLLAIPFKLLIPWLEADFQYFGLWELSAVIGQMLLGLLILHEFTRSYPIKFLGASLLVLSAPMIFRAFYHNSLSAHWILLAAIWFDLLEYRGRLWRGAWVVLFAVAILIHLYYIPMLIPLWMIGMVFHYRRTQHPWMAVLEVSAVAAALFAAGYVTGLFQIGYSSLSSSGFGTFSWNLNGLFNPMHFASQYLKEMPMGTSGQYEGFSYLGLGNLLILPVAVYLFVINEKPKGKLPFLLPFAAAAILFMLVALSHKAFVGETPLWDFELPNPVLAFFNLFRTSGRFIWPVFYFVVLFGLVVVIRNVRYPALVLALALLLQFSDLQPLYAEKQQNEFAQRSTEIEGEFWEKAAETNKHIIMLPHTKLPLEHEPLAVYAVHNQMTLNVGYFARSPSSALEAYAQGVWDELTANRVDPQAIYIITEPDMIAQVKTNQADNLYICEVDGFTVVFSPENELAGDKVDLSPHCTYPKAR